MFIYRAILVFILRKFIYLEFIDCRVNLVISDTRSSRRAAPIPVRIYLRKKGRNAAYRLLEVGLGSPRPNILDTCSSLTTPTGLEKLSIIKKKKSNVKAVSQRDLNV